MAVQQRRRRSRRRSVYVVAGLVASAVLLRGSGCAVGAGADEAATWPVPTAVATSPPLAPYVPPDPLTPLVLPAPLGPLLVPPAPPDPVPAFGAYLDYSPRGLDQMAQLSRWLGGAELRVGHTYLPGDLWSNIEGAPRFLEAWAEWRRERDDRILVLNVPMMERNEEGVSDDEVRALLWRGVGGEFDVHFRRLAERLVELGVPDVVLVLGWEMNGTTYTHRCGPDPGAWKSYWNRIVSAMRSVPGQAFRFDFAPSRGRDAVPWTECYPGDDTVDIIGMDAYDQPEGLSFDGQVMEPYGLQDHVDFAREHGKSISYPEWGLFRNGDNAEYMRRMLAWFDEHKPLYNTVTDYCPHGVWQCGENPMAGEVYRAVLFGRTAPEPESVPVPVPPVCSPLELGDWVEYWVGGQLCGRFDWWLRSRWTF